VKIRHSHLRTLLLLACMPSYTQVHADDLIGSFEKRSNLEPATIAKLEELDHFRRILAQRAS
jgi:hypothetical protein